MSSNASGVAVDLTELTRVYGDVKALDGLTLHIEPGELVALLGPSGCGKTTALRILAGLDEATSGTVSVGGRDVSRVPANKRDMGMVFQAYSLFPHLTALDNVAFGLKMRGKAKDERISRATEMLDLVRLSAHTDKYAGELSGGQQQRVALARALAIQPRVLLLDEPLSALDAKVRVQLRDEIRRLQLEIGTTTLFVTHDQEEALAVADRVGVMNRGRLEQLAAPADLYANPATPFVAEFVGLNNKVPAQVSGGQAQLLGTAVPTLPGSITSGAGLAMVRPEAVTVTADPAGTSTVSSVAFLGPISRLFVAMPDGSVISAQTAGSAARAFAPGDPVIVGMEPGGVLVVRSTPERVRVAPNVVRHARVPNAARTDIGERSDVLDGLDAEVPIGDQCGERDVAFREAPGRDIAAVHHRDHAGDDGTDGGHAVERDLGGAAGADHVVDEHHPGPGFKAGALDPLLAPALLLFLAHGEPRLTGDHRDTVGQRVRAHGESADGVELDPVLRGEIGDCTADDRQSLPGVDGVLAVDVVVAELAAGQFERLGAMLVAAGADQVERRLPGVGAFGG